MSQADDPKRLGALLCDIFSVVERMIVAAHLQDCLRVAT